MLERSVGRSRPVARVLLLLAVWAGVAHAQEPGTWGSRADLLLPSSEFAVAELAGRIYLLGGYPPDRVTSTAVQVYDVATDAWTLGLIHAPGGGTDVGGSSGSLHHQVYAPTMSCR